MGSISLEEDLSAFFCFQAVQLGNRERLLAFCEAVQRSSPVGSFTKPIAGITPGYASEVYWIHLNTFFLTMEFIILASFRLFAVVCKLFCVFILLSNRMHSNCNYQTTLLKHICYLSMFNKVDCKLGVPVFELHRFWSATGMDRTY